MKNIYISLSLIVILIILVFLFIPKINSSSALSSPNLNKINILEQKPLETKPTIPDQNQLKLDLTSKYLSNADLSGDDLSLKNFTGVNLSGADLSDTNLSGANLSGANLSGANLSRANLSRANLSRANLSRANLSDAKISSANLTDANISGINLRGAILSYSNLSGIDLNGVDLTSTNLMGASLAGMDLTQIDFSSLNLSTSTLSGVNLSGVDLSTANLMSADLSGSNLANANLNGIDLSSANLIGADLSNVNLNNTNLTGSNLSSSILVGVDMRTAIINEANFTGANLSNVNLSGVDLSRSSGFSLTILNEANLENANLTGLDLNGSILTGANLFKSNLTGVNLTGVNLTGVNLTGVNLENVNLSEVNLSKVDLNEINLRGLNLQGAILDYVDLRNKDLSFANISGVNLSGLDLSGINLTQANLSGVNFQNTNLADANLSYANLSNTNFEGSNYKDANFTGAKTIQMTVKDTRSLNWPKFSELENLNITNYYFGEDVHFFTTKDGFVYEYKNNEIKLVLDINDDTQFPFADDVLGGMLNTITNNKFIYISYTSQVPNGPQSLIVDEYSMDFKKIRNILTIDGFPELNSDHVAFGGALFFDSLGKLYFSVGDGGPQGDIENHSQNLNSLRGKILLLDVSELKQKPELIAYGLRNPWGVSIDKSDRVFITDCGWHKVESVNLLSDLSGINPPNFGWPVFQGTKRMRNNDALLFGEVTPPIYEYIQRPGCAVSGFYLEHLDALLFADFHGTLRILKQQKNGRWYLYHEYNQDNLIWTLGYDRKTKKIFIGPNSLELQILIEPHTMDLK